MFPGPLGPQLDVGFIENVSLGRAGERIIGSTTVLLVWGRGGAVLGTWQFFSCMAHNGLCNL